MPRFVILHHETPSGYPRPSHYDLMLEWGELESGVALRTWALPCLPEVEKEVVAEELAPHRLAYLDYEGEVAGDRGKVTRVAAGEYVTLEENANLLRIKIAGQNLAGEMLLVRASNEARNWQVTLR
jgi:hypothetical protein